MISLQIGRYVFYAAQTSERRAELIVNEPIKLGGQPL